MTFIKHVTDIEMFSKETKLVSLTSSSLKGLYMFVFNVCFLVMIMILEYGVTSYFFRSIEKYILITCMIVC